MAALRNDLSIDYICVTEGATDVVFYQNINNIPFKNSNIKYIYQNPGSDGSIQLTGKESVVFAYKRFNIKFPKDLKKCIFIIDHDYDGLDEEKYCLSCIEKKAITVLPVYSFENYFLNRKNVDHIFSVISSDKSYLFEFFTLMKTYIETMAEYFALRSVITSNYHKNQFKKLRSCNYGRIDENSLCNIEYINGTINPTQHLSRSIKEMRNAIETYDDLSRAVKRTINKYLNDLDLKYVRGKTIFRVLENFIWNRFGIEFNQNNQLFYENIVKILDIDIKVKFEKT